MASTARAALAKTSAAAQSAGRAVSSGGHAALRTASFAPTFATNAALSPTLTGLLLLVLTKGPGDARARIVRALGADAVPGRLERVVGVLKVLFAVGVVRFANAVLNQWALRQWRWRRDGSVGGGGGGGADATVWDFDGKKGVGEVVVVTGGCGGIGREVVRGLVEKGGVGVKVAVVDLAELPEEFEGRPNIIYYGCDLTSPQSIHETAAMIRADCGDPTVLINNAGVAHAHTVLEGSDEYDERLFRVNVLSHFTLVREFLPGMLAQKKGHIVTVASMASYSSVSGLVNYAASKAAVLSLHEGLNVELRNRYGPAGKHIVASIIHPMWARTPLVESWEASLVQTRTKLLTPADIADKIVRQVLRGEPAQLYVPAYGTLFTGFRSWPNWLQELTRDAFDKCTRPLDGGKGKGRLSDVWFGVGGDRDTFGTARSYDIVEG
ncbi:Short-chain dehydrogenase/reductase SDR [Macrophomina phaseolina MS6]|uniref:Short-chain dehydrogenase/reductase SDR n=1 Tax=Macrophomina phaseolina (strain MS6) TaxID=1126212 RepID=K2S3V2_MACPH|nr:Short-chain dehydrogenase/reductase SDR [Macrophomina phaseolina MS6]